MTKENVKELKNKLELQIIKTEELENKLKLQIIKNEELESKLKLQIIKTEELENKTKELENKNKEPSINWCKNDLILYCKNNSITGYSNLSKIKLIELISNKNLIKKGRLCSVNGNNYELLVFNITSNCFIENKKLNEQNINELGKSSKRIDLICNYNNNLFGIEIKSWNSPDWMQFSIKYCSNEKIWKTTTSNSIIDKLLKNCKIYDKNPSFLFKKISYSEWLKEKKDFKDIYIDIPDDTIRRLYFEKKCYYIQINNNYGLYHLGSDICNFNVPKFEVKQRLRVRIKVHKTNDKNNYCTLSITASCQPVNIKTLKKSNYSLDNISKLPLNCKYECENKLSSDCKYENKSPLRYPGGKSRACKNLDMILNNNFNISDFNTIISPFFGGGSFEFFLQNKYKLKIIANDKFTPLFNFWYNVKNNNNELVNKIKLNLNKIDKNKFIFFRNQILHENNILSQSVMYFIINRCSFSGSTLSGGFSKESSIKRFTESSCDRIEKMNLENFEIFNLDFQDFLEKNNNSLIFLDPPYYLENKSNLYGNNGDMHENFDHVKLYNYISNQKKWIMTYNNCEYIKKLYNKFKIIETNWSYGMNTSKKSNEIVIIG